MAKVECEVKEGDIENEEGRMVPGVTVTCPRCDHTVESFGTSDRSVRRCFVLLRDECPMGENNFYVAEE